MTKRETELAYARIAGYHGDTADFTRRLIERRSASFQAMQEAWRTGARQKLNGVRCDCYYCKKQAN